MHKTLLAAAFALLGVGSGCMYFAVVPGPQGQAWAIKASPFGASYWHCDATAGDPVCTQVTNAPAGGAAPSGGGAK
jgi:hypothetical protein